MSQTTTVASSTVASSTVDGMCVQASSSSCDKEYYLTLRGDASATKPSYPGKSIPSAQLVPVSTTNNCTAVSRSIPDSAPNTMSSFGIPNNAGTSKLTKPSTATGASQDEPQKSSSKTTLTKTRNWMAHIFPWQTVNALFESTLTKTGNLLARIFSKQNVENAVGFYDEKCHDIGTACRTASRNIYKRATAPRDDTQSIAHTAMRPSENNVSTKSWVAKKAKAALRTVGHAVRVLFATGKMALDAAMGAIETAEAVALYTIDKLCEE